MKIRSLWITTLIILILTGTLLGYRSNAVRQIKAIYDRKEILEGIEVYPYDPIKGLYFVLKDDMSTIDELYLVRFQNGKIYWEKRIAEARVFSGIKVFRLKGIREKVVQFYFHNRGSGYYSIYIVKGLKPVKVLETFAVDMYDELVMWRPENSEAAMFINSYIRDERLKPSFNDLDQNGIAEVILTGVVDYYEVNQAATEDEEKLIGSGFWKKVFQFHPSVGKFRLDKKRSYYRCKLKFQADYVRNND